jgi:hypothetical protein
VSGERPRLVFGGSAAGALAAIAAMFGGAAQKLDPVKLHDAQRSYSIKPRPGERPSTAPRNAADERIVEKRREKNFVRAAFRAVHGRRMNGRQWRKLRRDPVALEALLAGAP